MRIEHIAQGITLYNADCRDVLPGLPKADVVIADPPYGIDFIKGPGGKGIGGAKYWTVFANVAVIGDDQPFDPQPCIAAGKRVILWGANHYAARLPPSPCWFIWDKRAASNHTNNFADCEIAWCSWKAPARMFRHHWDGMMRASERGARVHPMQKPVALMKWCLSNVPPPVGQVLDPYMGSGTTGIAAVDMGFSFTGIEIETKYFDIACKRIEDSLRQLDLFIAKPPLFAGEQLSLEVHRDEDVATYATLACPA